MNAEQKLIFKSFIPPFIFVALLWLIKAAEVLIPSDFSNYGVLPRNTSGLIGIITAPLIHGDWQHLISNSVPFIVSGAALIYFYKEVAIKVFILIYLLSGFWLWLGGRENYHIGASGVVYGMISFLFFSGIFRKHTGLMALSLLVVFLYGGLIWGIFPLFKVVSWESHLFGSLAGILCAIFFRKEGPQRKVYEWEDETDEESLTNEAMDENMNSGEEKDKTEKLNINYIYKKDHPDDIENGEN
jgi:membrane associated rhomboid family serine protease